MHFSQSWNVNSGSKFLSPGFLRKNSMSTHRTKGMQIQFCFSFLLIYYSWYLVQGFNTEPVYGCQVVYCWALLPTQDVANVVLKLVIFLICLIPFHICLPMWTNLDNYFSYKIDNHTERIPPSSYTCPDVKSEQCLCVWYFSVHQ